MTTAALARLRRNAERLGAAADLAHRAANAAVHAILAAEDACDRAACHRAVEAARHRAVEAAEAADAAAEAADAAADAARAAARVAAAAVRAALDG